MVLVDCYNANPSSMAAALQTFSRLDAGGGVRKVVVLGDMLELGAAADGHHAGVGADVAAAKFGLLVAVGPHMKRAALAAGAAGATVHHFASAADARPHLAELLHPTDALLLKGSRSMGLEVLLDVLSPSSPAATVSIPLPADGSPHGPSNGASPASPRLQPV